LFGGGIVVGALQKTSGGVVSTTCAVTVFSSACANPSIERRER